MCQFRHNNGYLPLLSGVEQLSQKLQKYLRYCLGKADLRNVLHIPGMGGLLLCGGHGSGKTCIAKTVASYLERDLNTLAYCSVIKCTELSEDRISSVREKLQTFFDDAAWHAPGILLFDDLDRSIPAEVEHVDSFRFRQLAECFFHIASKMLKRHRITILATAQQKSSIHSFLTTSHLFSEIAQVNPPTKLERCEILKAIMSCGPELVKKSVSNVDLLSVASECEGYLAADLKTLVERTIHEGALQKYLRYCLGKADLRNVLHIPGMGGLLLCGGHRSGKTCIAKTVASYLERDLNTLAYCSVIKCTELSEDRISSVREKLQTFFDDAAWHAPGILLFDDLDRSIPAEVEHVDSFRFRQLAECFFHIASKMLKRHRITILATAQQKSSIHSFLTTSHLFSEIAQVNPPTKLERLSNVDLLSVASECEGYLAADLKTLVERTIHEGAVRNLQNNANEVDFLLIQDDFRKAQKGFVPFSLRGVKLHTSNVSWTDIGGLEETRKVLLETLEWPTKYASIFANCPLRLRSGLLLYGFPGCGKTLLTSAVAKECGLNFISVKGPELLNKYIGASEKIGKFVVRDLFERAQAAKPCALFFDEFDSIAPKRGYDSTGVTDRVVNQMLTQMDGAEGLGGVYVLAVTSRPDLIDPALLRPERIEILKALARKMDLSDDVDLCYYAKKCQGFSGADLQALLYNAHLEAIHETIDSEKSLEKKTLRSNGVDMQFVRFSASSKNSAALTAAERSQLTERVLLPEKVREESEKEQETLQKCFRDRVPSW
ncbi:AAA-domain-containing protein [Gigaspora margarita]|uniref:Peroxisomal ATPase PEX1 n=1 Tax=Gigaspora margarita TaxID=4874 RepID=A0A8H4A3F5_GIGMA|nr:AAA-domain-containing protein [Gigaspora margarita]